WRSLKLPPRPRDYRAALRHVVRPQVCQEATNPEAPFRGSGALTARHGPRRKSSRIVFEGKGVRRLSRGPRATVRSSPRGAPRDSKSASTRVCDALCVAGTPLRGPSFWPGFPLAREWGEEFCALAATRARSEFAHSRLGWSAL